MCFSVQSDLAVGIVLVPVGIASLREVRHAREVPFAALPLLFAVHQLIEAVALASSPVTVVAHEHALVYDTGVEHGSTWTVLYIVAVIGPSLLSGYPTIVAFGLLNLVGLTVVAVLYTEAFVSLWCVYAACTSLLVLLHMVRRRRLPEPHRLRGESLVSV